MHLVENNSNNPYFNLAAEEYLLKEFSEDYLMFYINDPSVIIGKHQNALSEINYHFIRNNNIILARRLSGGGTVYHDQGNLNFSFISNGNEGEMINFMKFTQPFVKAINELGVNASHSGQSDISIDGLKISGNAEHVYRKRILHHGTLLFSSNLSLLSSALKVEGKKYTDKSVKSVKSSVTNISHYIRENVNMNVFKGKILESIKKTFHSFENYNFSESDMEKIIQIMKEKYETWDWNYGYSPNYIFSNNINLPGGNSEINLEVERGIITDINISGYISESKIEAVILNALKGTKHDYQSISDSLLMLGLDNEIAGKFIEQLF